MDSHESTWRLQPRRPLVGGERPCGHHRHRLCSQTCHGDRLAAQICCGDRQGAACSGDGASHPWLGGLYAHGRDPTPGTVPRVAGRRCCPRRLSLYAPSGFRGSTVSFLACSTLAHSQLLGKDLTQGRPARTSFAAGRPGWTADSEHRPGTWQPHHRDRNHNDGPPDDGDSRDLDNEHGDNNIHDQTGAYLAIDNLRYQAMTNGMVAEVGRKQSRMLAQRTASYGTRLPDFEERSGDTMSFHVAAGPFCSSCLLEQPCFHMRLHVPMGSLILPNPSASLTGSGSSWQTCTRERNKWTPMIKMSRANDRRSGGKFSTNTRGGVLSEPCR